MPRLGSAGEDQHEPALILAVADGVDRRQLAARILVIRPAPRIGRLLGNAGQRERFAVVEVGMAAAMADEPVEAETTLPVALVVGETT